MANAQGKFVWYELMSSDAAASEAFYTKVVGWTTRDAGNPAMPYTVFNAGEEGVGGLWTITPEVSAMGVTPAWRGYIEVDDIHASAAQVTELGGAIYRPASEIPGVGCFAVVADPQGARFVLFQQPMEGWVSKQSVPGHVGWHELYTTDIDAGFEFYAKLFGWTKSDAIDMGPMGTYQMFRNGGEYAIGGMMKRPPAVPVSFWNFYVNVEAIDAAAARVTEGGGRIVHGPEQVPGGSWIVQVIDPQGASLGLVAPVR